MKTLALVSILFLLEGEVLSKNTWETSMNDLTERGEDMAIRKERRAKTSIIVSNVYRHQQ